MVVLRRVLGRSTEKFSKAKIIMQEHNELVWSIAIPLVSLLILCSLLFKNFSANAADDILRPLLGEKNTLTLEAVYFGAQDKWNAIEYTFFGAQSLPAVSSSLKPIKVENTDKMNLKNIPVDSSLPTLIGEGLWTPIAQSLFPQTVMAKTFIRPDVTHPYAVAYLVKMDMRKLGIAAVAGTYYPGGAHKAYGPGSVPKDIQAAGTLLAAFNGGFQEKDGQYGMVVGNKTYVPLKMNMPVLVLYNDGSTAFASYSGQLFPATVSALRQNGPYLVENSKITSFVEQGIDTWGRTVTNSMYTWRSGIGITQKGNLVYAVGNSLIPQTLAKALLDAGAMNAIQLDINPPWVRFFTYQESGNGLYAYTPLEQSMQGGNEYLRKYNKDFFYIYKK